MRRIVFPVLASFLPIVLGASSCHDKPPVVAPSGGKQAQSEFLGIDLTGSKVKYTNPPNGDYYAQLRVSAKLRNNISGPNAETFYQQAKAFFGIAEIKSISTSVSVSVAGVNLPSIIPYSYTYDQNTHTWTSSLSDEAFTPLVRLKPGTAFSLTLHQIASDKTNITTGTNLLNAISTVGPALGGTGWIISAASKGPIQVAAQAVQNSLSLQLSPVVKNDYNTLISPRTDGTKQQIIHVSDLDGTPLMDIYADVLITTTLNKPASHDEPTAVNASTTNIFSGNPRALSNYQLTGDSGTLISVMAPKPDWEFIASKNLDTFLSACNNLRNTYTTDMEFTPIDVRAVLGDTLVSRSEYQKDVSFYNNKACLTDDEKSTLKTAGFTIEPFNRIINVSDANLDNLAKLTKSADVSVKGELSSLFDGLVLISDCRSSQSCEPAIMAPYQVIDFLANLNADHFGCKDRVRNADGSKTGVKIAFTIKGDAKNYVLEGWGKKYVDAGIAAMRVREAAVGDSTYDCKKVQ